MQALINPATRTDRIVRESNRMEVDHFVRHGHYLHRWPGVVVGILGLQNGPRLTGMIVFGLPPRETFKRYGVALAWELARLFILDEEPKNTETWFMAKAVRHVQRYRPDVELLISYADPSVGHAGTIYKAGNWIADGRTDQERKTPRFDYSVAGKRYSRRGHVPTGSIVMKVPRTSKHRFVYWMKDHERKRQEMKVRSAQGERREGE